MSLENISGVFSSVVIQSNGKILVVGSKYGSGSGSDLALIRFNSDGSLDMTFDFDGIVTTDFTGSEYGDDIVIQADGKILVAGLAWVEGKYQFAVARYNENGSLDTNFDSDGKVRMTPWCRGIGASDPPPWKRVYPAPRV